MRFRHHCRIRKMRMLCPQMGRSSSLLSSQLACNPFDGPDQEELRPWARMTAFSARRSIDAAVIGAARSTPSPKGLLSRSDLERARRLCIDATSGFAATLATGIAKAGYAPTHPAAVFPTLVRPARSLFGGEFVDEPQLPVGGVSDSPIPAARTSIATTPAESCPLPEEVAALHRQIDALQAEKSQLNTEVQELRSKLRREQARKLRQEGEEVVRFVSWRLSTLFARCVDWLSSVAASSAELPRTPASTLILDFDPLKSLRPWIVAMATVPKILH